MALPYLGETDTQSGADEEMAYQNAQLESQQALFDLPSSQALTSTREPPDCHEAEAGLREGPVDGLASRVKSLPQELIDEIYALIFTTNSAEVDIIRNRRSKHAYILPAQLQVDKASRSRFTLEYYGQTTFRINDSDSGTRWLASLTPDTRAAIRSYIFTYTHRSCEERQSQDPCPQYEWDYFAERIRRYYNDDRGVTLPPDVFEIRCGAGHERRTVTF